MQDRTSLTWRRLFAGALCMACLATVALATYPPTPQQIAEYKADGTYAQRAENARALGNHLPASGMAEYANWRVKQLVREARGLPPLREMPPARQGLPTSGSPKILLMLVDFPEDPNEPNCPGYLHYANQTQADVYDKCFQDGDPSDYPYESMHNYFERASYGVLHIEGNVLGWYTAQHPRCYYSNLATTHSSGYAREALVMEAMDYFDSPAGGSHDFTQYDNDGDGTLDTVYLKYAGPDTGWGGLWWAYQTGWYLNSSYTIDGKRLGTYVWGWFANPQTGDYDVHTEIHETGHALGLPDYYDYDDTIGPDGGIGGLDMQHDNVGDWNCFSKFMADWVTPTTIAVGSQTITLNPSGTSQDCVLIMPDATAGDYFNEYYMAQYRKAGTGNDPDDYPTGLVIWHVDATLNAAGTSWAYDNSVTDHKLLRRMEADGLEEIEEGNGHADADDFYLPPDLFGPTTFPNSSYYTGQPTTILIDQLTTPDATMSGRFGFYGAQAAGASLTVEECTPGNGAIDPGETVTVSFSLRNMGPAMTDLVATLVQSGGVVAPSASQSYGALASDATASQEFTFTAGGACNDTITATLELQDGADTFSPVTFTFTLGAPNVAEDFDGVTAPALPTGWVATLVSGAGPAWSTTTSDAYSLLNAAYALSPGGVGDNRLDSPAIPIGSAVAQLAFWHKFDFEPGLDGGVLEISVDGGAFTDIVTAGGTFVTGGYTGTISSASNPLSGRWTWTYARSTYAETVIDLPASLEGHTAVFRWRLCTNVNNGDYPGWWIDSVRILNDSVCCDMPDTAACCLPDGSCADVTETVCLQAGGNWHLGETCETHECPQACCYGYPYTCENLTLAECTAVGGTFHDGETCATYTCEPPYCEASSSRCGYMFVGRVEVGTIDNDTDCTEGGYVDYSAMSTDMVEGTGYAITVTDGPPSYTGDQCGVWVDWNHNFDFTDPGEQITISSLGDGTFGGTITPPIGTPAGPARMRVRITWTGTLAPCDNAGYGETEDYTIYVVGDEAVCCYPDGTCAVTTEPDCTGIWHSEWADCSVADCPQPGAHALTLTPDASCYTTANGAVAVDIVFTQAGNDEILGGQFFLEYDNTKLDFVSADLGAAPFTNEVYEDVDEVAGTIDYAVGLPLAGDPGYDGAGPLTMATITFQAIGEVCDVADLVTFRDTGAAYETRLSRRVGTTGSEPFVPAGLDDLSAISLDWSNPTITCPANISQPAAAGCVAEITDLGTPVTDDNCGVASVTNDKPANDQYPVGDTTVTWTVTDNCGNTATCQQIITVTDDQNPTITCPATVTTVADAGVCYATGVDLGTPTTDDDCGVDTVTNDAPAQFPVGDTPVTWTVTDTSGNTATCTQTVTVTDNQDPTITCPSDVAVSADAGACYATGVDLGTPTTDDNCGVDTVTNDAPAQFPIGGTTVTWTVTDIHGNTGTCTQTVTVADDQAPTITCPSDVTVSADAGACYATGVDLGTPTTDDNCGVASVTNDAPAQFPVGNTPVIWTVTDTGGNTATCTQTVTVTDDEDPTITCPSDVAVSADTGACSATGVDLGTPTTDDNCGVDTVTNDAPAQFPIGDTTVTWTVTDIHGNTGTCTQTVTVTDDAPPVISNCPEDITVNASGGSCDAVVTWTPPTGYDDCAGNITPTATHTPGDTFSSGTTTVTYTFDDGAGNVSTCEFDVTVLGFNDFVVDVEIPDIDTAVTRCVTFTFVDCTTMDTVTFEQDMSFDATGMASATFTDLPCGTYDCVTAEDALHTLSIRLDSAPDFEVVGGQYVADFTGANALVTADYYNDNLIDIADFGVFIVQWGACYDSDGDTLCDGDTPCGVFTENNHADNNGDGVLDVTDYNPISANFLSVGDPDCCLIGSSYNATPRTEISVRELRQAGVRNAWRADLNRDGWIDLDDIELFIAGAVPNDLPEATNHERLEAEMRRSNP